MPENSPENATAQQQQQTAQDTPNPGTPSPRTFTQDEVNTMMANQKRTEREALANKYGDLDELKKLADDQRAAEEAAKTELQKEIDRANALAAENDKLKLANLRAQVAASKQVPAELLTGSTKEEMEAAANRLIEFRGPQVPDVTGQAAAQTRGAAEDIDAQIAEAEKARNFTLAIALKQRKYANKP